MIVSHVMHVEADGMRDAVHEEWSHGGIFRRLLFKLRHFEQAEVNAFLRGDLFAFGAQIFRGLARHTRGDLRAEDAQHGVVDLLLPPRELATYGNRPRHVAHEIAQTRRDVEQEQITFFANLIVLAVMQNVVIRAAGDNWAVGKLALVPDEFVREFRFDFGFIHAGFQKFAHALKPFASQVARGLDGVNLVWGFDDAQFVH